ncbi:recombinase family protein [Moraxella sp. Tifton1]|uniref:recombinase family protein n=1 Tax=Moraxella oculi TaxID=2940516 RepID=UPI0020123B9E|nr:recombinase family protein [Moraxella sp. Tifton1]MCL1624221.1 recombinase family protein [Moraxella sp. Tifton1]
MKNPLDQDQIIGIDEHIKKQKVQTVGYIRVSTIDQSTDRQLDGVVLDRIFADKMTGATKDRPQLQAMLDYVRYGDTVVVHSLDRLARSLEDLISIINQLNKKGVSFKSIKDNLTFDGSNNSPMDKFFLHILGAVSELERALIRERQKEGIAKAKQRGVYKGRKPTLTADKIKLIEERLAKKEKDLQSYKSISYQSIADEIGVSLATLNRYLAKRKKK